MKQYIGISRDHSGSMQAIKEAAKKDYNDNIIAIKNAANDKQIDTIVSVVKCGVGDGMVERESINSSIQMLKPLDNYQAEGQTPLFDSVGELIEILSAVPDASDINVSFLVMAVTDGQENFSRKWTVSKLKEKFAQLQGTDRWTFVFRVPRGGARSLISLGIPAGNIQEWETTERGMRESSVMTQSAISSYYGARSRGISSTEKFYSDMSQVSLQDVSATMTNISSEVRIFPVTNPSVIKPFFEEKVQRPYRQGIAFYQLTKPEKEVQSYKLLVVRNKKNGSVFAGQSARDLLGLPIQGTIKLEPGNHGEWDIFIQSTSLNRNLIAGTNLLVWENAR